MPIYDCSFPIEAVGLDVLIDGDDEYGGELTDEITDSGALVYRFEAPEGAYVGEVSSALLGTLQTAAVLNELATIAAAGGGGLPLTFVTLTGELADVLSDGTWTGFTEFTHIDEAGAPIVDGLPAWLEVNDGTFEIVTPGQYCITTCRRPSLSEDTTPITSANLRMRNQAIAGDLVFGATIEAVAVFGSFSGQHAMSQVMNIATTREVVPEFRCGGFDDQGDPVADGLGSENITVQISRLGDLPA